MATIHPTAIIAKTANIGAGTEIGPYVIIEDDVVIGENNIIEAHTVIKRYVTMGTGNHIHSHAVIGDLPQDTGFDKKKVSFTVIGDGNEFREFVNIHRSKNDNGKTVVGNNNYFMENSHVGHDCIIHDRIITVNNFAAGGHVEVFSDVFISACAAIHQFCRVGAFAMVGPCSVVKLDIPPFALADDIPARVYKLNLVGLRRKGFTSTDFKAIEEIYHEWYHGGMLKAQFLEKYADGTVLDKNKRMFVDFLKGSQRGLCAHL